MLPERYTHVDLPLLSPSGRHLLEQGYCVLPDLLEAACLATINAELDGRFKDTPFCVGPFHGYRTKRFHKLASRTSQAGRFILHPDILELTQLALGQWCYAPQLNLAQALEVHPSAPAQIVHRDHAMWPAPKGALEFSLNVIWPLNDFTPDNGATRVYPGSHHHSERVPADDPSGITCALEVGSALVMLGSCAHAAGANITSLPRRALIISYCLGWLKTYENQSLAYPPAEAKAFDPALAALVGYKWQRPNLGTYDGQCPSILLTDQPAEYLATVDSFDGEVEQIVERHWRQQLEAAG
jgi:ectoine hydroxylase-related dioxygenase (phytanoyl-CoA dioxygenase family)